MSLYLQLKGDIVTALKSKEKDKVPCLRTLDAALLKIAKDEKKDITDDIFLQVAKKTVKEKEASKSYAVEAGRSDLIDKANQEIEIISRYIPDTLSVEETEEVVIDAISYTKAESKKDMGKVMGYLKGKYGAQLDMGLTSRIVGEKLS